MILLFIELKLDFFTNLKYKKASIRNSKFRKKEKGREEKQKEQTLLFLIVLRERVHKFTSHC